MDLCKGLTGIKNKTPVMVFLNAQFFIAYLLGNLAFWQYMALQNWNHGHVVCLPGDGNSDLFLYKAL
jgi:hypothetical protein